ncbi:MAG TPA: glycosyltransferase [Candidatus Acidoferrum sp.]|jgi:ceramide glucosyltransferase
MTFVILRYVVLGVAAIPFIYYLIVLYSSWRFFLAAKNRKPQPSDFTPPVSNLKPVRGLDPDAYKNFASYCRQDYPNYELVFCVSGPDDSALPVIEQLIRDFPQCQIRVIHASAQRATNDKVAKLSALVNAARHEVLVINDADVRVAPDYLRSVVAPLHDPKVGGVTCLYASIDETTFTQKLQSIGMISDFYPGILVARQLDGVKFALGQTIVTTRERIAGFGGYQSIENRPGDDLLVGRLIAEQGYKVELLPYIVYTVADFQSTRELLYKRLRWMTVMRHMRPWGHLGLIFTHGLAWCVIAFAMQPTAAIALAYFGAYAILRVAITWLIGIWGMRQPRVWKKMPLIVAWDATAFVIWLFSFVRKSIRWRDVDYQIRGGMLVPVVPNGAEK